MDHFFAFLYNTIENAIKLLKYNTVTKNIHVKINRSACETVNTDSALIERVVVNILSGWLRFTKTNDTIAFDITKVENQTLKIEIK